MTGLELGNIKSDTLHPFNNRNPHCWEQLMGSKCLMAHTVMLSFFRSIAETVVSWKRESR